MKHFLILSLLFGFNFQIEKTQPSQNNPYYSRTDTTKLEVPDSVWREILFEELFLVARMGATEMAFTGEYNEFDEKGTYYCAVCGNALFHADSKFSTTCGWPSFYKPVRKNAVSYHLDTTYNMIRTEIKCARCDSHLGHVFNDGPEPTGQRFCMNSVCLDFECEKKSSFKNPK